MARKDRIQVMAIRYNRSAAIVPVDELSKSQLNRSSIKIGEPFHIEITTPRNPMFHRKAHALGLLLAENIDYFEDCGEDGHAALKLLQRLGHIECEEVRWVDPRTGEVITQMEPRSMSFDRMSEEQFQSMMFRMCQLVIDIWWHDQSYMDIMEMADEMVSYHLEHQ